MAKQRPSLSVQAQPLSTFVAPAEAGAAAVELFDQQSVNLALQFADAFKDFSLTAARLAGTLKQESNEEEVLKGMDMVNKSQKSYKQLVDAGEIKPLENPWMAIGAQKASGTVEGLRARTHFMSLYNRRAEEDPSFLESPDGFNALAAQYTNNVNSVMGNAPYMSRAFYESFNPFIASMGMTHEENIQKTREQKVGQGVTAAVAQAIQDSRSTDPVIRDNSLNSLQEYIDGLGQSGYSQRQINQFATKALVEAMADMDDPENAERLLNGLRSGTGLLKDTPFAKATLMAKMPEIEARRNRLTMEESQAFEKFRLETVNAVVRGELSEEDGLKRIDDFMAGPDRKITITAQEMESKRAYYASSLKTARREAEEALKEKNDEFTLSRIEEESQVIRAEEAGMSDDELQAVKFDRLKTDMARMGMSKREMMGYQEIWLRSWNRESERRDVARAQSLTNALWNGSPESPGLNSEASSSFAAFLGGGAVAEVPDLVGMKQRLDRSYAAFNIRPGTDKAKALDGQAYAKFDAIIEQQAAALGAKFRNGSLMPDANDTPEIRAEKLGLRGRVAALKMYVGQTFDDQREASYRLQSFIRGFNTQEVETGMSEDFEATLNAYMYAMQNNLPMDVIIPNPDSANGKQMLAMLNWASNQYAMGAKPTDIARDMVQMKTLPRGLGAAPFDLSKPTGWIEFDTGTGKDAQTLYDNMTAFRNKNQITDSDATLYTSSVLAKATFKHLGGKAIGNMKLAMRMAQEEVLNDHIIVRGSIIPKKGLLPFIDVDYVESWLRLQKLPDGSQKYPDGTTLVVVQQLSDGTALLAPRLDGVAQSNDLIKSTDLNETAPEVIRQFGLPKPKMPKLRFEPRKPPY